MFGRERREEERRKQEEYVNKKIKIVVEDT